MNAAVDVDGKGAKGFLIDIIQDLAINAVMSTMIGTHHSKTTAGTAAHHKFQKLLEEQFKKPISWLGFDVHILPEVFVDKGGRKVGRRSRGSLGVDILIATGPKGVAPNKDHSNLKNRVILDLKTGKGWSQSHINKLHKRYGDIPIIQLVVPIIGK